MTIQAMRELQEENAQLRAIVQELAESEPYTYNEPDGTMECLFCNDTWGWSPYIKQTKDHEPDCLITKARALIQLQEQEQK